MKLSGQLIKRLLDMSVYVCVCDLVNRILASAVTMENPDPSPYFWIYLISIDLVTKGSKGG